MKQSGEVNSQMLHFWALSETAATGPSCHADARQFAFASLCSAAAGSTVSNEKTMLMILVQLKGEDNS